ncbi:MAG: HAD family phosphatase [Candidatus Micrarchaeota archaeon]|nr:HAD family phosphatase [Candidatus Micrarchaeota archaeon]
MIKAIIFDFDGVIAHSEPIHRKSFNMTLKQLGIIIPLKLYKEKYVGLGSLSIMEDIFRTRGIRRSARFWVRKRMKVFRELVRKEGVKPVKGFMKFNRLLDKIGMKKIIASGGYRKNVLIMLKCLKLDKEFQFISREDVKKRKPDPEALLLAAKKLGVKPSECLVFEDSPYGIEAARRAGMKCVALTTSLPRKYFSKSCAVVKDFREVDLNLLRRMGYR